VKNFERGLISQRVKNEQGVTEKEKYHFRPNMSELIKQVSTVFDVTEKSILTGKRGEKNLPRWIAMYVCQEKGDHRLIDIAKKFGLMRSGSIPSIIGKLKAELQCNKKLMAKINKLM